MKYKRVTIEEYKNQEIFLTSYNPGVEHEIPITWEEYLKAEKTRLESETGLLYIIKPNPRNRLRIALYSTLTVLQGVIYA